MNKYGTSKSSDLRFSPNEPFPVSEIRNCCRVLQLLPEGQRAPEVLNHWACNSRAQAGGSASSVRAASVRPHRRVSGGGQGSSSVGLRDPSGLLLPSFGVHSHRQQPQRQQTFSDAAHDVVVRRQRVRQRLVGKGEPSQPGQRHQNA